MFVLIIFLGQLGPRLPPVMDETSGDQVKVKASHTRYRALGPELIPVCRQSARR